MPGSMPVHVFLTAHEGFSIMSCQGVDVMVRSSGRSLHMCARRVCGCSEQFCAYHSTSQKALVGLILAHIASTLIKSVLLLVADK